MHGKHSIKFLNSVCVNMYFAGGSGSICWFGERNFQAEGRRAIDLYSDIDIAFCDQTRTQKPSTCKITLTVGSSASLASFFTGHEVTTDVSTYLCWNELLESLSAVQQHGEWNAISSRMSEHEENAILCWVEGRGSEKICITRAAKQRKGK